MTDTDGPDKVVELRATSDGVLDSSKRLDEIEGVRRQTSADDPRLRAINAEAKRVATELVEQTVAETKLARQVTQEASAEEPTTINRAGGLGDGSKAG